MLKAALPNAKAVHPRIQMFVTSMDILAYMFTYTGTYSDFYMAGNEVTMTVL